MDILFAINKTYIQHFYATVTSLISNTTMKELTIHVMHIELDEQDIKNVESDFSKLKFNWYDLGNYDFSGFYINAHINYETYFRIIAPNVINADKVLYLDSDLIVRKDIKDLYHTDLDCYAVAAVYDFKAQDRKKDLSIPKEYEYFNAGVLLMNLNYWREKDLTNLLIEFILVKKEKLKYWDQDALNAILYDQVKLVNNEWNVQSASFESNTVQSEVLADPAIVHFTGASKPWHISCTNKFKNDYFKYLALTPFISFSIVSEDVMKLLDRKEKVYIWGAGVTGEMVYRYLNIDIEGFIDSNPQRIGTKFQDKCIYALTQIQKDKHIGIIICSGHYSEISTLLIEAGYEKYQDFVHQM